MSSKPKIFVLHLKELIYTAIFVILGILLILLLIFMFLPKDSDKETINEGTYTPGVYTSSVIMNNASMEIEVVVDAERINSIEVVNMDEAITTIYPLIEPSISDISQQIVSTQSLEDIVYSEDNKYTYMVLINGIKSTLEKATNAE